MKLALSQRFHKFHILSGRVKPVKPGETPKVHAELLRISWLHTCETSEGTLRTYIEKFWEMALDQFCLVRSTRSYGIAFCLFEE